MAYGMDTSMFYASPPPLWRLNIYMPEWRKDRCPLRASIYIYCTVLSRRYYNLFAILCRYTQLRARLP